jgi:hypothetical protein
MDLIHNLATGFGVAFTFTNLLYCLIGCILGTLIGVLPGIGRMAATHGAGRLNPDSRWLRNASTKTVSISGTNR